jgi:RNA polymerase sigma-70 factor (ECF subfamily)
MTSREAELQIVERIVNRDEAAFMSFVKEHEKGLYNYVFRQLKDPAKSEEIVQDVFVDFLEALRNFNGQSSLKTYLYSIAKYKVIDDIRRKKIKKVIFSALPAHFVESLSPVVMDEHVEKKEVAEKIQRVISKLPHDYQVILRLKYMDGERVKEISDKLSLTFKATESLLFRARKAFTTLFSQPNI